jgi:hypothetical protein
VDLEKVIKEHVAHTLFRFTSTKVQILTPEELRGRLVDLEKVIKEHVAHPLFRGRSSLKVLKYLLLTYLTLGTKISDELKVTLPVFVPAYKTRYEAFVVL